MRRGRRRRRSVGPLPASAGRAPGRGDHAARRPLSEPSRAAHLHVGHVPAGAGRRRRRGAAPGRGGRGPPRPGRCLAGSGPGPRRLSIPRSGPARRGPAALRGGQRSGSARVVPWARGDPAEPGRRLRDGEPPLRATRRAGPSERPGRSPAGVPRHPGAEHRPARRRRAPGRAVRGRERLSRPASPDAQHPGAMPRAVGARRLAHPARDRRGDRAAGGGKLGHRLLLRGHDRPRFRGGRACARGPAGGGPGAPASCRAAAAGGAARARKRAPAGVRGRGRARRRGAAAPAGPRARAPPPSGSSTGWRRWC